MLRHCNLIAPSPTPPVPLHQKMKGSSPSHSTESSRAKGFTLSPRQKWWLRMSCLWTLLQLSRAELPATLHHLPPPTASCQGEYWSQRRRCYPGTAPAQPRRIHTGWSDLERDTTLPVLWKGHRDNLSTQGQHTWGKKGPDVSLQLIPSSVPPCEHFVFTKKCS